MNSPIEPKIDDSSIALGDTGRTRSILRSLRHSDWHPGIVDLSKYRLVYANKLPVTTDTIQFCERLIAAFARSSALEDDTFSTSKLWDNILDVHHVELVGLLRNKDAHGVAEILAEMFRAPFMNCIGGGDSWREAETILGREAWALSFLDNLTSLAEYLGIISVENPQQGESHRGLKYNHGMLVEKIEAELKHEIGFPRVGSTYGFEINGRLFPYLSLRHIYTAHRIRKIVDKAGHVVEIGAGYGNLSHWLSVTQAMRRMTLIDLPVMGVLQGYFLAQVHGYDQVRLFGEENIYAQFHIAPPKAICDIVDVDLVINQDSMPEMPEKTVVEYLKWIRSSGAVFFSCNQENGKVIEDFEQSSVPVLVKSVGGFFRQSREQSWMRRGYVEEVYTSVQDE